MHGSSKHRDTPELGSPFSRVRRVPPFSYLRVVAPLLAVLVVAVAVLPTAAFGAPKVTVTSFTSTFTKGSSKMTLTMKATESGKAKMVVTDSAGRRVAVQNRSSVKKGKSFSSTWAGRTTSSNELGKGAREYVAAGRYKVVVTVTGRTGSTRVVRYVTVKSPPKPKISAVNVPTAVTPSAQDGARAMKVTYRTSVKYDVVLRVVSKATGKTVTEQRYENVAPGKTHAMYWDGQVTRAGSVTLPTGERAAAGDVAPPGSYTVRITSRGVTVSRAVTVRPAAVSSIGVTPEAGAQMNYEQSQRLTASLNPRGVTDRSVLWSSSDTSIAEVDEQGTVTTKRKEGKVTITATSKLTPAVAGGLTLTVRSDSTLSLSGLSVPKWCVHGRSVSLSGTVSSNQELHSVRIKVTDATGATEIDRTVFAGDAGFPQGSTVSIKSAIDRFIVFGSLSPGEKTIRVYGTDTLCSRTLYKQKFLVIGPTAHAAFWEDRIESWVFPLDSKAGSTSPFGAVRDGGARPHAAIDFIQPAGTKVYAMADGVVERISVGTYYAGTGAVQVKHSDGSVIWYCEVKAAKGLKVGDRVAQNQHIATIQTNDYGTAMLHLEAYLGKRTGNLYVGSNTGTYDYVTPAPFLRRRDLISPTGVSLLSIPAVRTVEVR